MLGFIHGWLFSIFFFFFMYWFILIWPLVIGCYLSLYKHKLIYLIYGFLATLVASLVGLLIVGPNNLIG